jgi:hypothetical protein
VDAAGNSGTGTTASNVYAIDTLDPVAPEISIKPRWWMGDKFRQQAWSSFPVWKRGKLAVFSGQWCLLA